MILKLINLRTGSYSKHVHVAFMKDIFVDQYPYQAHCLKQKRERERSICNIIFCGIVEIQLHEYIVIDFTSVEPHHEKTGFLNVRKQNCTADQRLCFRYTDSTILLLRKSEDSGFQPFSENVQASLCQTGSETLKTGFCKSRRIYC